MPANKGTVKSWSDAKGFGFIIPETGGMDVFVHRKVQGMGMQTSLAPNKQVRYDFVMENGKPKATHVTGDGVLRRAAPTEGSTQRQMGVVKNYNADKGYGFIGPLQATSYENAGVDLFFLNHQVTGTVAQGTRVTYSVGTNPKNNKPWAENIVPEAAIPTPYPPAYDPAAVAAFGALGYGPALANPYGALAGPGWY